RAANGQAAVAETARLRPDVVVLDLEMPVMDGMTALPLILAAHPGVKVIIASTLSQRNARISLEALTQGAHDYVPKPQSGSLATAQDFHRELAEKVTALGRVERVPAAPARIATGAVRQAPRVLAIGGSTGAPPALLSLFEALRGVDLPILLTQHMPPGFTTLLAQQLARAGGRPCTEGHEGERIVSGHAYVAPGGFHMTVGASEAGPVIRLNQDPPEHFCRPAVDPMLRSAAEVYGAGLMAVILTGMGCDGAEGCVAVTDRGGRCIVQDAATSVVWGMPGAASRTGVVEAVLPLNRIGDYIRNAVGGAR
ncbi:MAG: chemotaxis-specific protein-glutamate methyltransferase CheB, partial [Brevundimonas sp.]